MAREYRKTGYYYWVVSAKSMQPEVAKLNHQGIFCFTDHTRKSENQVYWASEDPLEPPDVPRR